jgi:hypothetical protein
MHDSTSKTELPAMLNVKRTATIAIIGGALVAWFAGAATSNRPLTPLPRTQAIAVEERGAALAEEIARLHERLRPTATPRQPARNLFAFRAAVAPAPPVEKPRPALSEVAIAPAAQPPLKFVGIAEDESADGVVRTAFVSGEGQLFMVKEGEMVTPRYRVAKIAADVIELQDVTDNSVRRLALR